MPGQPRTETAQRILDVAEKLVQTRGFNGFSYADIAGTMGVTRASLHYHFPGKADLGLALVARYRSRFDQECAAIRRRNGEAPRHLQDYIDLYHQVALDGRVCLCGMLAAEGPTLPPGMQEELRRFFDANEFWLASVLEAGRDARQFAFPEIPLERARVLLALLEGALLLARTFGNAGRFSAISRRALADLALPA